VGEIRVTPQPAQNHGRPSPLTTRVPTFRARFAPVGAPLTMASAREPLSRRESSRARRQTVAAMTVSNRFVFFMAILQVSDARYRGGLAHALTLLSQPRGEAAVEGRPSGSSRRPGAAASGS
jgi:hypothetical protein